MLIVKLGWFIVEMTFLSAQGIEYVKPSESKALYYRTRFAAQKLKQERIARKKKPISDIRNIKLLAIYHSQNRVVITVSKNNKSSVLVRGDEIDGYVLDDATAKEAIFLRNGKNYRITLIESKQSPQSKSSVKYVFGDKKANKAAGSASEGISEENGRTVVDKNLLRHYTKNMDDIWKNIGIKEIKEGGQIKGFKVNFVKRGSDFAKLGLKRGDVIKSINGQELNSYNSALEIYKNIDTMEDLTLTIKRGKEEMELEYEIH
jgi:general secretion pathway protein C